MLGRDTVANVYEAIQGLLHPMLFISLKHWIYSLEKAYQLPPGSLPYYATHKFNL